MRFLYLLTTFPWLGLAWTTTNPYFISSTKRKFINSQSTLTLLQARLQSIYQGPEDEEECPDEEECEINWDLMPSWDDDEDESDSSAVEEPKSASKMTTNPSNVARDEVASEAVALQGSRVRLEVNWQIDECNTDHDSCEDFCPDCSGAGKMTCRFCRGTARTDVLHELG